MSKVIVKLPDYPLTRSAEMRGCKYWVKRLDSVDAARSDGYAFEGQFEKPGATVEVPAGTWFLDYTKDVSQSGRVRGQEAELYQATGGGELASRKKFDLDGKPGWALRCRDEIAAIITAAPEPDPAALRAERDNLLARAAEISAILGDQS